MHPGLHLGIIFEPPKSLARDTLAAFYKRELRDIESFA